MSEVGCSFLPRSDDAGKMAETTDGRSVPRSLVLIHYFATTMRALTSLGFAVSCAALGTGACSEASNDEPEGPTSVEITVTVPGTPPLFVFRDDGVTSDWQSPVASGPGRYLVHVHGLYTVVAVCQEEEGNAIVEIAEVSRTLDDPHEFAMPCPALSAESPAPPPALVAVTGTMAQDGIVMLGRAHAVVSDKQFQLAVPEGTFDLLADAGGVDRIVVRRDVAITGPTAVIPLINIVEEGVPLVELPFTVTNLRSVDTLGAGVRLRTPSTVLAHSSPYFNSVGVLPDSALRPGDTQYVEIGTSSNIGPYNPAVPQVLRGISRPLVPGGSMMFRAPDGTDARFALVDGEATVTWETPPRYDTFDFEVYHDTTKPTDVISSAVVVYKHFTPSYLTAAPTITLESNIPGYKAEWRIDFTMEYNYYLAARSSGVEDTYLDISWEVNADVGTSGVATLRDATNQQTAVPCRARQTRSAGDVPHRIGRECLRGAASPVGGRDLDR